MTAWLSTDDPERKKIQAQSSSKVVEKEYSIARCVGGRSASLSPYWWRSSQWKTPPWVLQRQVFNYAAKVRNGCIGVVALFQMAN